MKRTAIIVSSALAAFFVPITLLKAMFFITDVPLVLEAWDVVGIALIGVWVMIAAIIYSTILTNEGE